MTTNKKGRHLVSIIIPTYRRADTLKRAIDSALAQTYREIEVIVVDDNAEHPDDRLANQRLIRNYPEIKLIRNHKNLGGGLSRNVGAKHAQGDYLAFLDDDDEFLPTKIADQMNLYESLADPNVGLIYCYSEVVKVSGTRYKMQRNDIGMPLREHIVSCVAPGSALFIPRRVFQDIGGFEDISSRQDATLIMKIILNGYSINRVPKELYRYYWHDGDNGITKVSTKSLEAEYQYRALFMSLAQTKVLPGSDIDDILCVFSSRLIPLLLKLDLRRAAWKEWFFALYKHGLCRSVVIDLFKIMLRPIYLKISLSREARRRLA